MLAASLGCVAGPPPAGDAASFDATTDSPDATSDTPDALAFDTNTVADVPLVDTGTADDAGPARCGSDVDCDDGLFCTGPEACVPSTATADARGCAAGPSPCTPQQGCDELLDACAFPDCVSFVDLDRDGDPSPSCGGGDCDDGDPWRSSLIRERCDGLDEDCDGAIDDEPSASAWCRGRANADGFCRGGSCTLTCDPGWLDCDGRSETGCEADPTADARHCGGCGLACSVAGSWCRDSECGPSTAWALDVPRTAGSLTSVHLVEHPGGGVIAVIGLDGSATVDGVPVTLASGFVVVRVARDGAVVWVVTAEGGFAADATTDASGGLHVVGFVREEIRVAGRVFRRATGAVAAFHLSLREDGSFERLAGVSASEAIVYTSVATDPAGVVIAGQFSGSVDLAGAVYVASGIEDAFIVAYDSLGAHAWHRVFGGAGRDAFWDVATLAGGGVLLAGATEGTVVIDGITVAVSGAQQGWLVRLRGDHTCDAQRIYPRVGRLSVSGEVFARVVLSAPGSVLGVELVGPLNVAIAGLRDDLSARFVAGPFRGVAFDDVRASTAGFAVAMSPESSVWDPARPLDPRSPHANVARLRPDGTLLWSRQLGEHAYGVVAEDASRTYALVRCREPCSLGDITLPVGALGSVVLVAIDETPLPGVP